MADAKDILLVEDNAGDVVLFRAALNKAQVSHHLHVADDGICAMAFLGDASHSPPDVVVLDLNLPRMSGGDVISQMLSDPSLRRIPMVILTSSEHDQRLLDEWDRDRCMYLIKSSSFLGLVDHVRAIEAFLVSLNSPAGQHQKQLEN